MTKLLLDEYPLVILPSLAVAVGLNEAIVLQQVHYWLENHRKSRDPKTFKNGRWWVYNSYPQWAKEFPFWSEPTIRRTFVALEKADLLLGEFLSDDPRDRTKWYTINYEQLEQKTKASLSDASDQIDQMEDANLIRCTESERSDAPTRSDQVLYKGSETASEIASETAAAESAGANPQLAPEDDTSAAAALVLDLMGAGVNRATAERLAREMPEECRRQLAFLPFAGEIKSSRGAYLRSAIEQGFAPPRAWEEAQRQVAEAAQAERVRNARAAKDAKKQQQQQTRDAQLAAARAQLEADPNAWAQVLAEAEERLPAVLKGRPDRVGYRPALEAKIGEIVAAEVGL